MEGKDVVQLLREALDRRNDVNIGKVNKGMKSNTDVPAYSDTLQTKLKCHCKWGVTVKGGFLTVIIDLGPA